MIKRNIKIGMKSGYVFNAGFPNVRINIARKFFDSGGFSFLVTAFNDVNSKWISAEIYINILSLFFIQEVRKIICFATTV